jgi:hypothetical protein
MTLTNPINPFCLIKAWCAEGSASVDGAHRCQPLPSWQTSSSLLQAFPTCFPTRIFDVCSIPRRRSISPSPLKYLGPPRLMMFRLSAMGILPLRSREVGSDSNGVITAKTTFHLSQVLETGLLHCSFTALSAAYTI